MRGGDLTFYRPDQAGRGLGGVLKSLGGEVGREAMPDIKSALKQATKRVAKRKVQNVFEQGKRKLRRLVGQRGGALGTKRRRSLRTMSLPKRKKQQQRGGAFKRGRRRRRAPQRRRRGRRHRDIFA